LLTALPEVGLSIGSPKTLTGVAAPSGADSWRASAQSASV
jgi:hypothetical protein